MDMADPSIIEEARFSKYMENIQKKWSVHVYIWFMSSSLIGRKREKEREREKKKEKETEKRRVGHDHYFKVFQSQ
jgi:hypothetical protein